MILLYVLSTAMEIYLFKIETRSWNPFAKSNWEDWNGFWILTLGLNAALWGVFRLCLLNYADAMWLNLTTVFVMGCLWLSEVCMNYNEKFSKERLLGLISLALILVGYEYATRDAEE